MKLSDYLKTPGALTVEQLRQKIGVKSAAQIRQWQHGYANRQPAPAQAVAIERATAGQVMRWDLRARDWWEIWPELVGSDGAPTVSSPPASTHLPPAPPAPPVPAPRASLAHAAAGGV